MIAPAPDESPRIFRIGLGAWLLALVVVAVLVCRDPIQRSVTPVFHLASHRFAARVDLYSDVRGFHYFPQFAILFAPFHVLPVPIGDVLWRTVSVVAALAGLWALGRRMAPEVPRRTMGVAALLALWPCLGAIRNGQTNLAFGGLVVLIAALLADGRLVSAAACLALLVAVKPLGVLFVVFAPAVYRRVVPPLVAALAVLAVLPFLFAPPAYVLEQYGRVAEHLVRWSGTTEDRFADLGALLRRVGIPASGAAATAMRAAGVAAFGALWLAARRRPEPERALALALTGTAALLLFNPMTEKNTYAVVAFPLALWAAALLRRRGARGIGAAIACAVLSIGIFPELFHRVDPGLGLWWDPFVLACVAAYLAFLLATRRPLYPRETDPAAAAPRISPESNAS